MTKKDKLTRQTSELKRINEELKIRGEQQAAISKIGLYALSNNNITELMNNTVNCVAEVLDVEFCKILELMPDKNKLLMVAGVGWKKGLVGKATVATNINSQAGYTLLSKNPVVVDDLRTESRFKGHKLLSDHDIASGISVIIHGKSKPYGILGVHTARKRVFTNDDINFIQAIANILSNFIDRKLVEKELTKNENLLQSVFDGMPEGISVLDKDLNIIKVNHTIKEWFSGLPQLTGEKCYKAYHNRKKTCDNCPTIKAINTKSLQTGIVTVTDKKGKKYWRELFVVPLRNDEDNVIGVVEYVRDITKQKESEDAIRQQKEITEQKNVALNEMLKQLEIEKKKLRDNVIINAEAFLLPVIDKLKLSGESRKYVKLLKKNVNELMSSFGVNLLTMNAKLTSRETEICDMIRNGLSSKEIARLLHIGLRTIDTHRNNIRRKLNVDKRNVNLESFLKTL